MKAGAHHIIVFMVSTLATPVLPARGQLLEVTTSTAASRSGAPLEVTTAFVRVPELRQPGEPRPASIELATVRVRQTGKPSARSAHVLLAGGPGDSGVSLVTGLVQQADSEVWRLFDGDIIGIDQRGTGRSRPNLDARVPYNLPLDRPGSIEEWLPRIHDASRMVAEGFRARGIRLEAYNTRESADDVAAVVQALGYERVTLWGRSYGSHLALATAARYPAMIDRLVLVSPEGPDHTWKRPSQVDVVIDQLVARGATDLRANMRKVLIRLTGAPVSVRVTDPMSGAQATVVLGAFDIQWIATQALGDPRLVATLPAAFREMAEGNFERLAQIALVRRTRTGVDSAMKHMMDASSGASADRRRLIESEARDALLGNAINFPGMFAKEAWGPVTDMGEEFRRPVVSNTPTLILVGDLDPRTPVANAREIAATLPRAHMVVLENATHQFDLFGAPAVRDLVAGFLRGEAVAERVPLPPVPFR